MQKNSIHLDLNLDAESYPQIYTDQERVFQVISIIFLDNAVSYSKENSNIEILTSQTSKEFTFLVVDHGCGIAEKDKPLSLIVSTVLINLARISSFGVGT